MHARENIPRSKAKQIVRTVTDLLHIIRHLRGIGGLEAVMLWWRYRNRDDLNALKLLLAYNREDVVNLKVLRERLGINQE